MRVRQASHYVARDVGAYLVLHLTTVDFSVSMREYLLTNFH